MNPVKIYTTPTCPYCHKAKQLLESVGAAYEEIDVSENVEARERIVKEYGHQTVPAIFIGDTFVGGFDDLAKLQGEGKLMELLD